METAETIVGKNLKRTRMIFDVLGAVLLVAGGVITSTILDPSQNYSGIARINLMALMGLVYLFGVVALFAGLSMWNVQRRPIMQLLRDHPQDIAQIITYVTRYRGMESFIVRIVPKNGKQYNLSIQDSQQVSLLVDAIHELAPYARIEYSKRP